MGRAGLGGAFGMEERAGRTFSDGHVGDDPLDGVLALVAVLAVEVSSELEVLACGIADG